MTIPLRIYVSPDPTIEISSLFCAAPEYRIASEHCSRGDQPHADTVSVENDTRDRHTTGTTVLRTSFHSVFLFPSSFYFFFSPKITGASLERSVSHRVRARTDGTVTFFFPSSLLVSHHSSCHSPATLTGCEPPYARRIASRQCGNDAPTKRKCYGAAVSFEMKRWHPLNAQLERQIDVKTDRTDHKCHSLCLRESLGFVLFCFVFFFTRVCTSPSTRTVNPVRRVLQTAKTRKNY